MARPVTEAADRGTSARTVAAAGPGGTRRVPSRRAWYLDAGLLGLLALVVRLPALFAPRALTFDEGVYGSAVLAMRDGARPFLEIFSSQGPLQLPLLWLADLIGFRTLDAPRLLTVASGIVVTVATYAIARRVAGRGGAILAGALVATSGSLLWVTAPISGDGPAIALAVTAVALAFAYRAKPTTLRAVGVGVAMGAALSIKLLVVPAAIPVGLLLLRGGRLRALVTAVGAAVVVFFAAALPWGLSEVWDQSVAFHQNAPRTDSYGGNAWRLVRTLCERDVILTIVAVAAAVAWAVGRFARRRVAAGRAGAPPYGPAAPSPTGSGFAARALAHLERPAGMFGAWLVVQAALLVWEPQMWRPHVSEVIVPLALLVALRPPPWRVTAVVALLALPWYVVNVHTMLWPEAYSRDQADAVARIRALPPGAWAISDDPALVWRADRRTPGNLVDASIKRIQEGMVTAHTVARGAALPQVCAVVVWSSRYGEFTTLPHLLADEGYHVVAGYGGPRIVYEKRDCEVPARG
jgi:4-amino-4-deoxy-L-arabinose transferase-like glycosyltransferase